MAPLSFPQTVVTKSPTVHGTEASPSHQAYKGERVRQIIEQRGCEPLYLPPYSPNFNPIEEAFAELKALLRRAEARTRQTLMEAMGRALDAVTASDARGFFDHRGYRATVHLL